MPNLLRSTFGPKGPRHLVWCLGLVWFCQFMLAGQPAMALAIPAYQSAVTDEAELLSRSERRNLEERIKSYTDSTGIEIGILTITSLDGTAPEDYAHDVFEKWGIGSKSHSNGVLFLVAWDDHVARIEVGYGLEGALTDLEAGRIVSKRSPMAEQFRSGDRVGGFEAVLDGIQAAIAGDYDPPELKKDTAPPQATLLAFFLFMVFIMIMAGIARRRARRLGLWGKDTWGSGGFGGFGGFGGMGGLGGFGGGRSSGGGFTFGGGSSGGGGASGGW